MADPRRIVAGVQRLADDIAAVVPKCLTCGRPDGGVIRSRETPWEAGLVDRKRCPETVCPMRAGQVRAADLLFPERTAL